MVNPLFWLSLSIVFVLIEIGSPGFFYFLSCAVGALAAAASAWLVPSNIYAVAVFITVSYLSFFLLSRYVASMQKNRPTHRSNVQRLIGMHALVVQPITVQTAGSVKLGGELWSALTLQKNDLPVGTTVQVVAVRGVHLVVVLI